MFTPVFDADFFPSPLSELQRESGALIPALIRVTALEGLVYGKWLLSIVQLLVI